MAAAVKEKPELAILIPCYNEEITIGKVIEDFRAQLPDAAIYVFDNCCTDRTAAIAREHGAHVIPEPRKGKGFVVESMFDTVKADWYVLVDGDDHNEPVADAVRGILDGHIVMERAIAERGRYPAINILKSISRTMPPAADPAHLPAVNRARQVMATYSDMEELIRLGAYRTGSSPDVDEAIALHKPLEAFLAQLKEESTTMAEGYQRLEQILQREETQN